MSSLLKSIYGKLLFGFCFGAGGRLFLFDGFLFGGRDIGVFFLKFLYAAFDIHQFLLAGKERVAGGTNINTEILLGRTDLIDGAASASRGGFKIFWMNAFFHNSFILPQNAGLVHARRGKVCLYKPVVYLD